MSPAGLYKTILRGRRKGKKKRLLLLRVGIWRVYFLLEMNDQSKAPPPRLYQDRRVTTRMSHLLTDGWLHLQAFQDSKTWFFVLKLRV